MASSIFDKAQNREFLNLVVSMEKSSLHRFFCNICLGILTNPIQTECGCRYCSDCLHEYLGETEKKCLICKTEIIKKENTIFDRAIEKEITQSRIKCPNGGCTVKTDIINLQAHLNECSFQLKDSFDFQGINEENFSPEKIKEQKSGNGKHGSGNKQFPAINAREMKNNNYYLYNCNNKKNYIEILKEKQMAPLKYSYDISEESFIGRSLTNLKEGFYSNSITVTPEDGLGRFTCRVRNIRKKIISAKNEGKMEIRSHPFYITNGGYHMILKVYPNGDREGTNNFLSIYCAVVKGEFDDFLSWPFKEKITITVRSDFGRDVSVNILPDGNPLCYGRPNREINRGFGEPKFIYLSHLLKNNECINRDLIVKLIFSS